MGVQVTCYGRKFDTPITKNDVTPAFITRILQVARKRHPLGYTVDTKHTTEFLVPVHPDVRNPAMDSLLIFIDLDPMFGVYTRPFEPAIVYPNPVEQWKSETKLKIPRGA